MLTPQVGALRGKRWSASTKVSIDESGAAVHVGQVVIHFADSAYTTPSEARVLAKALVELADYADGAR